MINIPKKFYYLFTGLFFIIEPIIFYARLQRIGYKLGNIFSEMLFGGYLGYWRFIYFILAIGYLLFALSILKTNKLTNLSMFMLFGNSLWIILLYIPAINDFFSGPSLMPFVFFPFIFEIVVMASFAIGLKRAIKEKFSTKLT